MEMEQNEHFMKLDHTLGELFIVTLIELHAHIACMPMPQTNHTIVVANCEK